MSHKKQHPSYYSTIIAEVRYSKKINANEKLLYSEITALTNKYGYCWASNKHFSKLYDCTPQAISKWIINLEKNGFISCERIYAPGGKEIKKRIIRLANNYEKMPYFEENEEYDFDEDDNETAEIGINNGDGGINQSLGGINQGLYPYQHRIEDNTTSYNTTSNNNNTPLYSPRGEERVSTLFGDSSVETRLDSPPTSVAKKNGWLPEGFDEFYDKYGKKVGKDKAQKAWAKLKPEERQKALEVVSAWVGCMVKDRQYQPHPATWLNSKRFNDELSDDNIPAEVLAKAGKKLSQAKKEDLLKYYRATFGISYNLSSASPYMAGPDNIATKTWWIDPDGFLHRTVDGQNWSVYKSIGGNYPDMPGGVGWTRV